MDRCIIGKKFIKWQKENPEKEILRIKKIKKAHLGKKFTKEHRKNLSIAKTQMFKKGILIPWNKGLTKYNDIRIKKYGIKNSKRISVSPYEINQRVNRLLKAQSTKRKNFRKSRHYSNNLAFRIFENICMSCKKQGKLLAHHIDRNFRNNKPENLSILCYSCHNKIIKGGKTKMKHRIIKKNPEIKWGEHKWYSSL